MTMKRAELGIKRACLACGMRFYDLNRRPIICPGCGAEFDFENIIKSRKNRASSKANPVSSSNTTDNKRAEKAVSDANELVENDEIVDVDQDIDFDDEDVNVDVDEDGPGIIQDDLGEDDELLPSLNEKDEG